MSITIMSDGSPTLTIALGGVTLVLLLYYLLKQRGDKYPPGPWTLPILGNLLQVAYLGSITKFAQYYRKRFGDAFSIEIVGSKRVVLSGYDNFRELLVKGADYTSNRSTKSMTLDVQEVTKVTPGLFWAPFPHWKILRSFAISTLRKEGMGKATMEPQIMEEIEQYISKFIEPNLGKPMDVTHSLSQATCNVVSQLLYGKRFDYDDETTNRMISAIQETMSLTTKITLLGNLPYIGKYLIKPALAREQYLSHQVMLPTLQSYIDEHKDTIDRDNPRDLTDRYLIHSETAEGVKEVSYAERNAKILALHLYVAGMETTSTALRWILLFMCLHPEMKFKVEREIEEQIGFNRPPSCKDRVNMPYTDAVLLETMRKGNIVPIALPHTLEKETVVDGVTVPAGADLMLNMASVLHDESVFEEPEKFKPERYLTGDIALKKQRTIPFGIGRRACLGESLAKMELFMFFVTLLQRFDFRLSDDAKVTDEPLDFLVSAPKPYDIVFTSREN